MTNAYGPSAAITRPDVKGLPDEYSDALGRLFERWGAVRGRNAELSRYFDMKTGLKDLGISIPPQLTKTNCVVGWCCLLYTSRCV